MGAVDNVISGLKKVKDIADQMKNAELLGQIAELMMETATVKGRVVELEDENRQLRQQQDYRSHLEFRGWALFTKADDSDFIREQGPGPFCQVCMNTDGVPSPIQWLDRNQVCPRCGGHFRVRN